MRPGMPPLLLLETLSLTHLLSLWTQQRLSTQPHQLSRRSPYMLPQLYRCLPQSLTSGMTWHLLPLPLTQ